MKHSIFLFLLFFAFSSSVNFKMIRKPGIYLWEISDNFNEISKHERFDLPNETSSSSNVGSSEESDLGIPDTGILELGIVPQRMNTHNTLEQQRMDTHNTLEQQRMDTHNTLEQQRMDTHNTYIILKITRSSKFTLYYWVGAQSSEEKRINVAHFVGHIFMKIYRKIPETKLRNFYREAEGVESTSFLTMVNSLHYRPNHKLYRVAGTKGQFIMEVPLTPNQLNGSDSFVFYKNGSVFTWNSLHSNENIRRNANVFGTYIHKMKNRRTHSIIEPPILITEGLTDRESSLYNSFTTEFFKDMKSNADEKRFPHTPYYYTDEDLENKRREEVKLYKFSNTSDDSSPYEVRYRDLKLQDLYPQAAHVLADLICGKTFVIFGRRTRDILVQKSLSFAETHSRSIEVEDAWQRVNIILLDKDLPSQFKMYFSDLDIINKLTTVQ